MLTGARPGFEPTHAARALYPHAVTPPGPTHMPPLTEAEREALGLHGRYLNEADQIEGDRRELAARYPDDNPKTIHGIAKPPLGLIPGTAMVAVAEAMRCGMEKYGPANWRDKPVTTSTYTSAALRHLFAWIDGEDVDPESGATHLAHAMACMAILVDAQAQGTLNDDRPTPGKTAEMIRSNTRKTAA